MIRISALTRILVLAPVWLAACAPTARYGGLAVPVSETGENPNSGSGVFIDRNGDVLTAAHVVADCQRIEIGSEAIAVREAVLAVRDDDHDAALLRAPGAVSGVVGLNPGNRIEPLSAYGYAAGSRTPRAAVSRPLLLNRWLRADAAAQARHLLWLDDASIAPGWSGGPLIDANGNLAGLIRSVAADPAEITQIIQTPPGTPIGGVAAAEPVESFIGLLPASVDLPSPPDHPEDAAVRVFCWPR